MNDTRHYERLTAKPAWESRYSFILTGVAINDVEARPALWAGLLEETQDMPPAEKAYCKRWNPTLAAFEEAYRRRAIETLRLAGMPEAKLNSLFDSKMEALIEDLARGYRSELKCLEEAPSNDTLKRGAPFDGERYSRELCARVIQGTAYFLKSPGHETTAKYLNDGLPLGKTGGLDRHHVRRAAESFNKMLERLIRATRNISLPMSVLAELLFEDCITIGALDVVYQQARMHPKLRMYRGEELALAIDDQFDLNERIHRAADFVRRQFGGQV